MGITLTSDPSQSQGSEKMLCTDVPPTLCRLLSPPVSGASHPHLDSQTIDSHPKFTPSLSYPSTPSQVSEAMKQLCTDVHVFRSWTAVGGQDYKY